MKTNCTYQDSHDPEDCSIWIDCTDVHAVPAVGEMVVLFGADRPPEDRLFDSPLRSDIGTPVIVKERLWTLSECHPDEPVLHISIIIEKQDPAST